MALVCSGSDSDDDVPITALPPPNLASRPQTPVTMGTFKGDRAVDVPSTDGISHDAGKVQPLPSPVTTSRETCIADDVQLVTVSQQHGFSSEHALSAGHVGSHSSPTNRSVRKLATRKALLLRSNVKPTRASRKGMENWCSICGRHVFGLRARRIINSRNTCERAECQKLALQLPLVDSGGPCPLKGGSRGRMLLNLLFEKAAPKDEAEENVSSPKLAVEEEVHDKSLSSEEASEAEKCPNSTTMPNVAEAPACDLMSGLPIYEHLRRNRCLGGEQLNKAPRGESDLGVCQCKGSCELGTCLNAVLGIECSRTNCAFGAKWRTRCNNRQFQKAENTARLGNKDSRVEVFQTGTVKGFGLRASQAIDEDNFVIEYVGEVVPHATLRSGRYAMLLKDGVAIDASRAGGIGRFANHSCAPNCYAQRFIVSGEYRVGLFSSRAIMPGEEITFSYASSGRGFGDLGAPEVCHCGESRCRGFIGIQAFTRGSRRQRQVPLAKKLKTSVRKKCIQPPQSQTPPAIATLDSLRARSRADKPPSWAHAKWVCQSLYATPEPCQASLAGALHVAQVLDAKSECKLEPFFGNTWPGKTELACAGDFGIYLPSQLAMGRQTFLDRLEASASMPRRFASSLHSSLLALEERRGQKRNLSPPRTNINLMTTSEIPHRSQRFAVILQVLRQRLQE